jgi:hypothetical protein
MTKVPKLINFKHKMYVKHAIDVLNTDMIRLSRIVVRLGVAVFSERNM